MKKKKENNKEKKEVDEVAHYDWTASSVRVQKIKVFSSYPCINFKRRDNLRKKKLLSPPSLIIWLVGQKEIMIKNK
jgi:hypothetical protein